ncbi:hypothetical protein GGS20DRAFT_598480 [Poronia punctata]|nr:hypothetical protein GGS20DRAFT_598480 [Poronia punctata]
MQCTRGWGPLPPTGNSSSQRNTLGPGTAASVRWAGDIPRHNLDAPGRWSGSGTDSSSYLNAQTRHIAQPAAYHQQNSQTARHGYYDAAAPWYPGGFTDSTGYMNTQVWSTTPQVAGKSDAKSPDNTRLFADRTTASHTQAFDTAPSRTQRPVAVHAKNSGPPGYSGSVPVVSRDEEADTQWQMVLDRRIAEYKREIQVKKSEIQCLQGKIRELQLMKQPTRRAREARVVSSISSPRRRSRSPKHKGPSRRRVSRVGSTDDTEYDQRTSPLSASDPSESYVVIDRGVINKPFKAPCESVDDDTDDQSDTGTTRDSQSSSDCVITASGYPLSGRGYVDDKDIRESLQISRSSGKLRLGSQWRVPSSSEVARMYAGPEYGVASIWSQHQNPNARSPHDDSLVDIEDDYVLVREDPRPAELVMSGARLVNHLA